MKNQLFSTITMVVLSGFMLLGFFSGKTFSFLQTEKRLAIDVKNTEISSNSDKIEKKVMLTFPTKSPSIINAFLPGPLYPPPDTTKKRN